MASKIADYLRQLAYEKRMKETDSDQADKDKTDNALALAETGTQFIPVVGQPLSLAIRVARLTKNLMGK